MKLQDHWSETNPSGVWDAVVLGAGVSGLISTRILQNQGLRRILVIDRYPSVGGNHIDVQIGPYTFDIGLFLFQEKSALMKYFPEIERLYTRVRCTFTRITPTGDIRTYPFSAKDEVFNRPPSEWLAVAVSLLASRIVYRRFRNARDYACYWIGRRLFVNSGLENYIERFYGAPADRIEVQFAEKRMTWIAKAASTRAIIEKLIPKRKKVASHSFSLMRPREGFEVIYSTVRADLERSGATFDLHRSLVAMHRDADIFVILDANGDSVRAKRVISTIPLEESLALCRLMPPGLLVQTATLVSLFFSYSGNRGFSSSMLYNFSRLGEWKRITMESDVYGKVENRDYFTVEINRFEDNVNVIQVEREFREDVGGKKLFVGDLVLEGSHILKNAYPVYGFGATAEAADSIAELRSFGVQSFGRQGGFDYLPNTVDVINTVERALH